MAKVIATSKGYFGGVVREPGEAFGVPDELWNDEKRRPSWAILAGAAAPAVVATVAAGEGTGGEGKPSAHAGDGKAVEVPADWPGLHHSKRKALAKQITGEAVHDLAVADSIIAAHVEATKPAPFSDAPAPQTVAQAQKEAGGMQPDWEAPGEAKPVAD
ncbi:hypothetical protein ACVWWG_007617 [Bradyrhizobium sp. LB7.2]